MARACVLRPNLPTRRPAPEKPWRVGGGAEEGRRVGCTRGWWVCGGGEVEYVTLRPVLCQSSGRGVRGCNQIPGAATWGSQTPESCVCRDIRSPSQFPAAARSAPGPVGRRAAGGASPRQGPGGTMAAGSITTLPTLPEDGASGAFPPGHFKDPKRLYCKNGGFFLRIHPDGRVDGVREKSDPHRFGGVPVSGEVSPMGPEPQGAGASRVGYLPADNLFAWELHYRGLSRKYVTDECFFFERLESNNYNTYRSRKYTSWYVALKRTGQYKLGPKTGPGQKAILFLPMSAKS
ncbi:PREDICTED: fibroblast growth factor 2 [Elephantulus edwardii]|uniref:fibroblast growth factor 2 n=1 Tax=Elephantulus edwardii TaxID=28737 RepID=UPI0003F0944C|nr:PREDICTED: fibroblast growth factor 2 [Elephantulus edwardii]